MLLAENKNNRRSIRLKEYDYSQIGAYFVTICSSRKRIIFGDIKNGIMGLSEAGIIAYECWNDLPNHFPNIELDEISIMPNHIHFIVIIDKDIRRGAACSAQNDAKFRAGAALHYAQTDVKSQEGAASRAPTGGSLSAIVGSYKSAVTNKINKMYERSGISIWQRNYYEHIIRNGKELNATRKYIQLNPANWEQDKEYLPT